MNAVFRLIAVCGILSACLPASGGKPPVSGPQNAINQVELGDIETTADGRCFARADPPTQTIIVDEQVVITPEIRDSDGEITTPAVMHSVPSPKTIEIGEGTRFETICPPGYTLELVSTLQRALRVRGDYLSPINGKLDATTLEAIGAFQRRNGLASNILAISVARELGVIATPLDLLDAG